MSLKLVSENPLKYIDVETGKNVPVRSLLDVGTGKKIYLILQDDIMTVVHIPKELGKNKAWRDLLGIDKGPSIPPIIEITVSEKTQIENITNVEV